MEKNGRGALRRWRLVALVAVGVAIGSALAATPVSSHVGGTVKHVWTKHIRPAADKRYYTKAQANARYAAAAHNHDGRYYAAGSKVADAETVDGLDSTAFLRDGAPAGGELTGTYPSPSLAPNSVQPADIADNAVGSTEVADNTLRAGDTFRLEGAVSVNVPSVPAHSCIQHGISIAGRQGGDLPIFFPTGNFASLDLSLYTERDINDGGSFFVTVCNVSGAAIDPPAGFWGYVVIRP